MANGNDIPPERQKLFLNHLGDGKPYSRRMTRDPILSKPSGRWQTSLYLARSFLQTSKPSGRWQTLQHLHSVVVTSSKPSGRWQTKRAVSLSNSRSLNHLGDGKPNGINLKSSLASSKPSGRWQTCFLITNACSPSSKPSGRWQTQSC